MKLIEIDDSQFENLVLRSSLPVLLLCTSPECIICKTMTERILESGKAYLPKMLFLKLNINENKRWQDFQVRVIPTLLYFKNGVLVGRQDNFPEVEDIQAQIKVLVKKEAETSSIPAEFKTAIDLENIVGKFYKYVYLNVKNGQVKEKFRLLHQQSLTHKGLVQKKLQELSGELYASETSGKFEGSDMKPQSYSLLGALKMAIKIQERLLLFYKKVQQARLLPDKELCQCLLKEKTSHLKIIKREMKFMQNKEFFKAMDSPEYPTWLNKIFE